MGWGGSAGDDDRPRQPGLRRTDTRMSKASPSQLSAAEVAEYLRQNPAFFVEHDDLLADLLIPHQSGQAVSLVERQVKLLRERNIDVRQDRKSTRLNSSHVRISYAVFCLKKKNPNNASG